MDIDHVFSNLFQMDPEHDKLLIRTGSKSNDFLAYKITDITKDKAHANEALKNAKNFGMAILRAKSNTIEVTDNAKEFLQDINGQIKANVRQVNYSNTGKAQISAVTQMIFNNHQIKRLDESKLAIILEIFQRIINEFNEEKLKFNSKSETKNISEIHIVNRLSSNELEKSDFKQNVKAVINTVLPTFSQFEVDSLHEKEAAENKRKLAEDYKQDDEKKDNIKYERVKFSNIKLNNSPTRP